MKTIPKQDIPTRIPNKRVAGISDGTEKIITAQLTKTMLAFDEYPEQQFDLADLQADEPKRLRFTTDRDGNISIDAAEDYWLIAEIDLPAKTYTSEPVLDESGETVLDENGEPKTIAIVDPIIADIVQLTAWQLQP